MSEDSSKTAENITVAVRIRPILPHERGISKPNRRQTLAVGNDVKSRQLLMKLSDTLLAYSRII